MANEENIESEFGVPTDHLRRLADTGWGPSGAMKSDMGIGDVASRLVDRVRMAINWKHQSLVDHKGLLCGCSNKLADAVDAKIAESEQDQKDWEVLVDFLKSQGVVNGK